MDVRRIGIVAGIVLAIGVAVVWLLMPRPRVTATASLIPPNGYDAQIATNEYAEGPTVRCDVGDKGVGTDSFTLSIEGSGETTGYLGVLEGAVGDGRLDDALPISCSIVG